jgi:hypothetical protein
VGLHDIIAAADTHLREKYGDEFRIVSAKLHGPISDDALWANSTHRELNNKRFMNPDKPSYWEIIYTDSNDRERWILKLDSDGNLL